MATKCSVTGLECICGDCGLSLKEDIDAVRYRWLKEHHLQLGPDCWIRTGDDLDDAIDAEIDAKSSDEKAP